MWKEFKSAVHNDEEYELPDKFSVVPGKGNLLVIKAYWTAGVWSFMSLVHLILSRLFKDKWKLDLPLAVSAAFSCFNIMVQVHLNGWAPRAIWDEWELGGKIDTWDSVIDWERRRFNRSVEARLLYLAMFFASTVALGCSYYRIFRVQEETTKSRGSVPKAAIFLVTAGMTLATVSISNNSGALVEQSKGATNYKDYGIGIMTGWYTIFVVAWTLPTIQNPALGKLTLRIIMSGIGMGAVQGAVSLRILSKADISKPAECINFSLITTALATMVVHGCTLKYIANAKVSHADIGLKKRRNSLLGIEDTQPLLNQQRLRELERLRSLVPEKIVEEK